MEYEDETGVAELIVIRSWPNVSSVERKGCFIKIPEEQQKLFARVQLCNR